MRSLAQIPICLCALLFLQPQVGFATILFQENFEDANFASRGWYDISGAVLSSVEHVSGSTKSLELRFLKGQTTPNGGNPKRIQFPETDSVYVSYWIKYSANWQGQPAPYDHHEFYLLTNQSDAWSGLAWTKLTAYIEQNHGVPTLTIQDGTNIDVSKVGVDLTKTTELRSVGGCNGDSDGYGEGECYSSGGDYYNGKDWQASQVYFSDTPGPTYKNAWHHVEVYFKLNSVVYGIGVADGIMNYWYDGQRILDFHGVVFRTGQHPNMKFNQFVIAPYLGDGSVVDQAFWIDNLSIDTAPPNPVLAAPSNLKIVK